MNILHRRRDGRWRLIEVKSTASPKEEHLDDLAIQHRVASRSGLDLASSCLAHVNRNYVYTGGDIDVWRFFRIKNLTRRVERLLPKLTFQLRSELRVLVMPNPPGFQLGSTALIPLRANSSTAAIHRSQITTSVICQDSMLVPPKNWRKWVSNPSSKSPDDFPLSERQRIACTSVQTGQAWFSAELGMELESLKYPLYFMDFESVNPAIPRFSGMRPFDQLPFQWSVHVLRRPDAEPERPEFFWRRTGATPDASSSIRCVVHSGRAAASLSTPRSNRSGSRNSRRGCPSSRNGSRKSNVVSGICSPSSETMSTILRSQGRTR